MNYLEQERCMLCPRCCGVRRTATEGKGFCAMPSLPVLARAALHFWEEPCLAGTCGAGAVFFSGCSLRCVYCQNESISHRGFGRCVSIARLREIFEELITQGAHNIDLVNPTHFAPAIAAALEPPLSVPVVWNSSGYERVETLRMLEGKVQIYLPDFKYPDAQGAQRYSSAVDYPDAIQAALAEMLRQTGPFVLDEAGLLQRGVLIRHLLLPGRLREAKMVMDFVAHIAPVGTVLFSLMGQYLPFGAAKTRPPLDRRLRESELRAATAYMQALGLVGYTQGLEAAQADYVPAFDLTGVE